MKSNKYIIITIDKKKIFFIKNQKYRGHSYFFFIDKEKQNDENKKGCFFLMIKQSHFKIKYNMIIYKCNFNSYNCLYIEDI